MQTPGRQPSRCLILKAVLRGQEGRRGPAQGHPPGFPARYSPRPPANLGGEAFRNVRGPQASARQEHRFCRMMRTDWGPICLQRAVPRKQSPHSPRSGRQPLAGGGSPRTHAPHCALSPRMGATGRHPRTGSIDAPHRASTLRTRMGATGRHPRTGSGRPSGAWRPFPGPEPPGFRRRLWADGSCRSLTAHGAASTPMAPRAGHTRGRPLCRTTDAPDQGSFGGSPWRLVVRIASGPSSRLAAADG